MRKIKKQVVLITTLIFIFCGFSFGQGIRYTGSYTPSSAIVWGGVSNKVIDGLSFTGLDKINITLCECSNITIQNCKFSKSAFRAISAENSKNLIIQDCVFDSVADGILINCNPSNTYNNGTSSGIKVVHNYFKNMIGGFPGHHAILFSRVNGGGGNQINYNSFEGILNQSKVDDVVNINSSYSSTNDSLQIIGNWFRGADYSEANHTGGGITFGDGGGSYVHVKNNIFVNQVGIGNAGATNCVVENNTVYQSKALAASAACGYIQYNFSINGDSTTCHDNTWQNNRGYCTNSLGDEQSYIALQYIPGNCTPAIGKSTNIVDRTLNESILPQNIAKAKGVVTETDPTSSSVNYKIFPNPVFGQSIIITSENPGNEKISIYNMNGQTVVEKSINTARTEINTSNLVTGIYVITISKDNTILETRKIRV